MNALLRRPITAALVAFALILPVFVLLKAHSAPHYSISHAEAVSIARQDPTVAQELARFGYTKVRVSPLDKEQQRVSFFNGSRLVLHASVGPEPRVTRFAVQQPGTPQSGSAIANYPPLLIGLTLLFVLAVATVPLLSLRNLDVVAFAGFTLPFWLINAGFIDASVLTAYPLLAYLVARCLWVGLRGREDRPRASLYSHLTGAWSPGESRRVLNLVLGGLATLVTILTVTSSGANDVAFASLAGATDLLRGTVPYGHIPSFIVHGDTYPLLNYVLYVPAAALMPVTDAFSDPQGALLLAAVAALLTAVWLYRLAGPRGAIAWLAFPPVVLAASSGTNDVLLALCLVAVMASTAHYRRSALLLGVAAWVKLIPILALPIWLARMRRRSALEVIGGLLALSGVLLGWLVLMGGPGSIAAMARGISYQFDRGSLSSLWIGSGLGALQPVAQAGLVAAVVASVITVREDTAIRDSLPRLAALLTGILLFAQVAANYWTWAYLPWAIAPALLVLIPGHATSESRVAEPATFTGRQTRAGASA